MNETTKFVIRYATIAFISAIAVFGGCTANIDYRVSKDIAAGADPMKAACAHGVQLGQVACGIVAAKP